MNNIDIDLVFRFKKGEAKIERKGDIFFIIYKGNKFAFNNNTQYIQSTQTTTSVYNKY